jgi:diguanylate cyclase (GGDEF)-like protein
MGDVERMQGSRSFVVIHYVSWVGIVAHTGFIALFAFFGVPLLAIVNVFSLAAWIGARVANARMHPRLAALLLVVEVTAHAVLACAILGWQSGFHYYLIPLIPFVMFHDQLATRTVVAGAVGIGIIYIALRMLTAHVVPPATWDARADFVPYVNMLTPLVALSLISIYFRFASFDAEHAMEALAMTDALTRLANRRRMRDLLDLERVRHQRNRRPFAVIIGDLDDFKLINDKRGHHCGDHVLVETAAVLGAVLRAQDGIARWGGEEFLFLLPDTDLRGARIVAEKLRAAVAGAAMTFGGHPVATTMTLGVAVYAGGMSLDECVRRADEALYAGKSRGKNQVVVDEVEAESERRRRPSVA